MFGAAAVAGLDLQAAIRDSRGWPPEVRQYPGPFCLAIFIGLVVSGGLAWAAGSTGQINGPIGAITVGVAAPLVIQKMAKVIPLDINPSAPS
jgi:hypothetical protein